MYLNTHTNLDGPTRFRTQAQSGGGSKKKKKKNRSSGLFTALVLWSFSCFCCLSRTPGLPRPWGPRDSGLWFGKLADEVFVCLLLREGRGEEEAQGKGVQSLAGCVRRLVSIHSVGPGRAWGDRVFPEQVTHPDLSLCSSPGCDRLLPGRSQPLRISVGP